MDERRSSAGASGGVALPSALRGLGTLGSRPRSPCCRLSGDSERPLSASFVGARASGDVTSASSGATQVTVAFCVPAMWAAIDTAESISGRDLSSLRYVLSGGAPCPLVLIESLRARRLNFLEGFGLTETAPIVSVLASAAIFALVNPPIAVMPVFGLGVVAALVYDRTRLLIGPMAAHAVYNAAVVGYQFVSWGP